MSRHIYNQLTRSNINSLSLSSHSFLSHSYVSPAVFITATNTSKFSSSSSTTTTTTNTNSNSWQYFTLEQRGSSVWLSFNRPNKSNAFDDEMIGEITHAFRQVIPQIDCRSVVLTAQGSVFSAGADLNWMKRMAQYTEAQNKRDAEQLYDMFYYIRQCHVPVIGRINGSALGGGSGLVAACDFAFSVDQASFGFTEVRLGLIPAVISRFVMDKIGIGHASRFFITGERFNTQIAKQIGLIQQSFESLEILDQTLSQVLQAIEETSPAAVTQSKKLIEVVSQHSITSSKDYVTSQIAKARVSEQGQQGLTAFLSKKTPSFIKKYDKNHIQSIPKQ